MAHYSRRDFLKTGLATAALAGAGSLRLRAARETATDWVTLGRSGVKVTRLALGTGTMSGKVQRELGQEQFTRQVRYAYDHGIRFFETAESYGEMHRMLGVALKGIPRHAEHPVHLAVGLSGLKEANAVVVGVAHLPGKLLLSQLALHLAAHGPGAQGEPRHFHARPPERHPIRRGFARRSQPQASGAGERRCGKSGLQEITSGVVSHSFSSYGPHLTTSQCSDACACRSSGG